MAARLRAPGWYRAGLWTALGVAFSYALSIGLRTFDFWLHWAAGRPTVPDDHSDHGAHSWRDYFRPNTDHKVIGVQYVVNSFVFLFIGGLMAMLMRAELGS